MKSGWLFFTFLLIFCEAAPRKPENPFEEASTSEVSEEYTETKINEKSDEEYEEEETTRPPIIIPRQFAGVTPAPVRQNILYTILPTLQKKTYKYCPYNQYTFMMTCKPGKKLRYDLQVFCQEFADYCGVPNLHRYPSRTSQPEWRPAGYGQKQKNGHVGLGRSLNFGVGAIPGFELTAAKGAEVGNIPGFEFGGLMLNEGTDIGVLGERIGKSPARTMAGLESGYPSFGLNPNTAQADQRAANAALRQLGIPPLPGLAKALGNLQAPGLGKKPSKLLFEPGYDAVDRNAPIATGKTDGDSVNLPATFGKVEILKGIGMGIGKK